MINKSIINFDLNKVNKHKISDKNKNAKYSFSFQPKITYF